jgi:hypothetical protein
MSKPIKDKKSGQFVAGGSSVGRRKGARNKLHTDFIVALLTHFHHSGPDTFAAETATRGEAAIEIVFRESPKDYLKLIASIVPKEFIVEDGRLEEMGDDEIAAYLEALRSQLNGSDQKGDGQVGSGAKTSFN